MDQTLKKAYQVIFGEEPEDLEDWRMAELLMDNFNVPELGEDLAKEVIFRVTNHVEYPNSETTQEIVIRAERKATELFDGLSDEPHMDDIAWEETKYWAEKRNEGEEGRDTIGGELRIR